MAAAQADNSVPRGQLDLNTQISHCFSRGGAWDPGGVGRGGGRDQAAAKTPVSSSVRFAEGQEGGPALRCAERSADGWAQLSLQCWGHPLLDHEDPTQPQQKVSSSSHPAGGATAPLQFPKFILASSVLPCPRPSPPTLPKPLGFSWELPRHFAPLPGQEGLSTWLYQCLSMFVFLISEQPRFIPGASHPSIGPCKGAKG